MFNKVQHFSSFPRIAYTGIISNSTAPTRIAWLVVTKMHGGHSKPAWLIPLGKHDARATVLIVFLLTYDQAQYIPFIGASLIDKGKSH